MIVPKWLINLWFGGGIVDIIIEITGSILEQRLDKAVANFHGEEVDWIFFCRIS